MKKRTFGRIAAVGLAGITAIPAISIVASADVTITANKNKEGHTIITGSAWKVHWSVRKTKHSYTVNANGTLSDSPTFVTSRDPEGVNSKIGTTDYPLEKTQYWMYKDNGASIPDSVKAAVDSCNAEFNNYKTALEDYAWYYSCTLGTNHEAVETSRVINGVQYYYGKYNLIEGTHDLTTGTWGFVTANPSVPGAYVQAQLSLSKPDDAKAVEYTFIDNAANTSITLSALTSEIGTSYVMISGNEISPSTSGTAGSYVISGSSSSTNTGNTSYGTYDLPAGYLYSDSKSYTVDYVTWYPNLAALRAVWGSAVAVNTKTPNPAYSSTYCCFNPVDGNYYTVAQVNSGSLPYARQVSYGTTTSHTEYAIYRVDNGYYYYTWSSAYAAAGNDASRVTLVGTYTSAGNYFSRVTGSFYNYYEDALYASRNNSSLVVSVSGNSAYGSYYDDPYYYYFMNRSNSGSSSSSSLGGSSVKIGNRSGWSNVRSSIRSAKSGASLSVSMNGETSIPEEILTALDGKNVDVNFKLKNGAVVTINGQDVSTPKDINVAVTYNTKNVPSGLVKKATSVNNSLSTSQISVSSNTFGGKIGVTVKYSENRAGCTAKIYRYNSSRNSLQLVDTSTVSSSGKVAFDGMTQGGDFVIVLFKN